MTTQAMTATGLVYSSVNSTVSLSPRIGDIVWYYNTGWNVRSGQRNGAGPYPATVLEKNANGTLNLLVMRRGLFNSEVDVPMQGLTSSTQYYNVKSPG